MIECQTLEEARAVENLIHIEAGSPIKAWQQGDALPAHLVIVPPSAAQLNEMARATSKQLVDASDPSDRVRKAVLLVLLDEINALRAAVVPVLPARTRAQLVNAIKNKIDAGAAD
jgi:hypothetical protein